MSVTNNNSNGLGEFCTRCGRDKRDDIAVLVMGGGFPDDTICAECLMGDDRQRSEATQS